MSKFEDNGGYYIDGVPYMDCKYTGEPVRNVSTDVKYVISDKALQEVLTKDRAIGKKAISEKEKFSNGLNDVLSNEQIVLYHVFAREMLGEAKEKMRNQRKRGKDMKGLKGKRKRW